MTVCGELDICTETALAVGLRRAVLRSADGVVLDLTGTTFCDCSGLNVLPAARRHALQAGKTISIHAASPSVRYLLTATGTAAAFAAPAL
ncbi:MULTISPECIES: STAS domain-containing protein [unclassified Streptomyces]|uniref:STAS domain-containing protein n=1 Tax=unclassified Streptomyces TaxID=2593676 RepID=UPI00331E5C71